MYTVPIMPSTLCWMVRCDHCQTEPNGVTEDWQYSLVILPGGHFRAEGTSYTMITTFYCRDHVKKTDHARAHYARV